MPFTPAMAWSLSWPSHRSVDVEIATDDERSRVATRQVGKQLVEGQAVVVVEDQELWLGFACEVGQLRRARVVFRGEALKVVRPCGAPGRRLSLVDQHVTA